MRLASRRIGARVAASSVRTELRRHAHRAQHAHRVLAVARLRIADHAQHAFAQVGQSAVVSDDLAAAGVVVQRVDAEVAPARVFLLRAEYVVAQHASVLVLLVSLEVRRAEGRHLDCFLAHDHVHQAEAAADDERAAEQRLDLLRTRVGGHVVVLGDDAEQQVAHRAADHVGGESGLGKGVADLERSRADRVAGDAVLAGWHALRRTPAQAQNAANELLDHEGRGF